MQSVHRFWSVRFESPRGIATEFLFSHRLALLALGSDGTDATWE